MEFKNTIRLSISSLNNLAKIPEAGMGYHVDSENQYIFLSNGIVIPTQENNRYYNLLDFESDLYQPYLPNDIKIGKSLGQLQGHPVINPNAIGAVQLLKTIQLNSKTVFYRYLSSSKDFRFVRNQKNSLKGQLTPGTYLSTYNDKIYLNTGFGVVGRLALPNPYPPKYVTQYEFDKGTMLDVGTVAPKFGQPGGGVEVRTKKSSSVREIGRFTIPDY